MPQQPNNPATQQPGKSPSCLRVLSVVGARPNFMKIAPFIRAVDAHNGHVRLTSSPTTEQPSFAKAMEGRPNNSTTNENVLIEHALVHTGQHYDYSMSQAFFDTLGIPDPDIHLEMGSGTHAEQVGKTMIAFEKVLLAEKPDWVVVVGDVNATAACSITAAKHQIKVAHIEAGLRSFDLRMPEEINRILTDRISDLLLTPDDLANENLRNEGVSEDKIKWVGDIMIDTLEHHRSEAEALDLSSILSKFQVSGLRFQPSEGAFAVLTLHRPSNVDDPVVLSTLVDFLTGEVAEALPLVWTMHPRTKKQLEKFGLWEKVAGCEGIVLLNPVGYCEMMKLNMSCSVMLTDSGGLQEECCVLGTPCITLRENTERPITLRENGGVCALAGNKIANVRQLFEEMKDLPRSPHRPPKWDGETATRIVSALLSEG